MPHGLELPGDLMAHGLVQMRPGRHAPVGAVPSLPSGACSRAHPATAVSLAAQAAV
ncbi:hypothetical protein ACWEWI_08210 [Streptomyces sp. NPDC003753]|uniref:hypothetical protein n=1 Tax=Streptomyces sp. NPDC058960 TaxID=3346679 RepID=UPI0036BC2FEE